MMKKSTIALAAVALVLSGGFATAGDYVDVEQNDNNNRTPHGVSATPSLGDLVTYLMSAGVIDIDQNDNGPRGGGGRTRTLLKPKDDADDKDKGGRFIGTICLVNPIAGQLVCWGD